MERRKFVVGLGALASGSAAAMGTGAFTSVQAERGITIDTAGDGSAYVGISPYDGPNGEYASTDSGTVSLDFTETEAATNSTGLNDQAKVNIENVLQITNNGTQPVYVTVKVEDSDGNTGLDAAGLSEFGVSGDRPGTDDRVDLARAAGDYDGDKLPTGESVGMGFFFNFDGPDSNFGDVLDDIDTITIIAAASQEELDRFKPS